MPNGNLLVMNADMEAAQVLGAARSFMKTNIPSFSGITTLDPQLFATYFIKFCASHAKRCVSFILGNFIGNLVPIRPLNDFKSLVSADDFLRLKEFMYIDSPESLKSFSEFIDGLGVKKIHGMCGSVNILYSFSISCSLDWWAHKEMNDWVIPCLVKSQSNIYPNDWDSTPATTNTGEAQHHWTNSHTGIKLTLVDGIER